MNAEEQGQEMIPYSHQAEPPPLPPRPVVGNRGNRPQPVFWILLGAALVVGLFLKFYIEADAKPPGIDLAKVESRVFALETKMTSLISIETGLARLHNQLVNYSEKSQVQDMAATNAMLALREDAILLRMKVTELTEEMEQLKQRVSLLAGARPVQSRPAPVATGMKMGIPAAVYDGIAAKAAQEWPGDFEMQQYTIKNQVAAYQKLNSVR